MLVVVLIREVGETPGRWAERKGEVTALLRPFQYRTEMDQIVGGYTAADGVDANVWFIESPKGGAPEALAETEAITFIRMENGGCTCVQP